MYILRKDDPSSQAVLLSESPVTLGSLVSNRLIVEDQDADAIHCMIEKSASGKLRLTDLSSRIGVILNGHRIEVEAELKDGDQLSIGGASYTITNRNPEASKPDGKKNAAGKNANLIPFGRRRPFFNPVTTVPRDLSARRLEVVAYWGNTVLNIDHFHRDLKGFSDVVIGDPVKSHFISGDRSPWASWVLAKAVEDSYLIKLQDGMRAQVRARGITTKLLNKNEILLTESDYAHIKHGVVDYFIRYVTPPEVKLPDRKLENKFLAWTGSLGSVAYIALVALAILVKPQPIAAPVTPPPWQEIQIESMPKMSRVAEIRKDLPKTEPVKVEPPKSVQPVAVEKPKQNTPVKQVKPVTNIVEKNLATNPETAAVASTSISKKETAVSIEKIAALNPSSTMKTVTVPGLTGGPGQTLKTLSGGPLKGSVPTSKPGVEGQSGKQAAFVDLKNLSGKLGPVLSKDGPGGINVSFRPTGGGGMKQGSASKNYNLGEQGSNGGLAIPGSGDRIGDWGKNPSGQSGGITGALSIPGKNHQYSAIAVKPQDPLTGPVSLTQEEIYAVIRQNLNQIRHCYEQTLQRSPKTQGRVKVRFTIAGGGRVISPEIAQNNINDTNLDACILGKLARWQFPLPRAGNVNVSYPFDFFPQL